MKIVYLCRRPIPSVNAHSVQIVAMCEAFAKNGHQVTLLAHRGDQPSRRTFARYGVERLFRVQAFPYLFPKHRPEKRFIRALQWNRSVARADLFFGRDIGSLVQLAGRGKPIVYEAHSEIPHDSKRGQKLARLFSHPDFHHLVCVTEGLADSFRANFPALAGKPILVVPNGASPIAPQPPVHPWPGRPGHLQVGFIGRPYPGKGIELLAVAAQRLPEMDFHIVGGSAEDLHWIEPPFPENLHIHGYQPRGELGRYYAHFDVAAAPYSDMVMNYSGVESGSITSPLKLVEYLAAGIPAVVSDLPGVRDMVRGESEAALLITPGNAESLVESLQKLADGALRARMRMAARREFEERHTTLARARAVLGPLGASAPAL